MNMIRRSLAVASIVAVCTLSSSVAHASTVNVFHPVNAFFGKDKTVKLSLRNDSGTTLELRAGDSVMQLEAGKTLNVSLPAGTRISTNTATKTHAAGDLLVEVTPTLSGATIAIS
ncbi:hypothetical protein [Granulicella sp. dw_53]|uniref:hypothetical protein n=1 Tax=Granulicella sp. dw_53 TaxID=2719792 RepID=UPI001BD63DE1|nr:hypothetical protein [Granulicella sp. dw_53]